MEKLMIIDGNSILNRAFYGLQGQQLMSAPDGLHTNAIFGFLNILNKFLADENPQYLCVAFDMKAPTFRHLNSPITRLQGRVCRRSLPNSCPT